MENNEIKTNELNEISYFDELINIYTKNDLNIALRRIRENSELLKNISTEFHLLTEDNRSTIEHISWEYLIINNLYGLSEDLEKLHSIVEEMITSATINHFVTLLNQLLKNGFDLDNIDEGMIASSINIMNVFFNYSDASIIFQEEICKNNDLLSLYYGLLKSTQEACVNNNLNENVIQIIYIVMGTLYNTLLHNSESNLKKMRKMKYLDIIKNFHNNKNENIKIYSLLFTAYTAEEGDSILFKGNQDNLTYILSLLTESLTQEDGRANGLSTEELAKGIEKLSKNEINKQLLVDLGVLPILKKLMETDIIKYKELSLSILWSLAFDEINRKMINDEFFPFLNDLKSNLRKVDEDNIRTNDIKCEEQKNKNLVMERFGKFFEKKDKPSCTKSILTSTISYRMKNIVRSKMNNKMSKCSEILDGLMWTLQRPSNAEINITSQSQDFTAKEKKKLGHIMISYCWANSDIVMNIYDSVKALGYKVWIDKYNMSENENLMESMAIAVENSEALIICVSNAYKESQNCRAEAQYAVSKMKPLIPVIVQQKYKADGWLGFCISGLMYCNFKGKNTFEESMKELSQQLKRISSTYQRKVSDSDHITPVVTSIEKEQLNEASSALNWSNSQVREWFKTIGVERINWKNHYDGKELNFLNTIANKSIETFVHLSENQLEIKDLRSMRIFYNNVLKL